MHPDLKSLLDALDPDASQAERHLWLIGALRWIRADATDPLISVERVKALLDTVEGDGEWLARWHRWWGRFVQTVDATPLLADHGFAPRTAFLSELGHRLRRKLLPGTPETNDMGDLFGLLLPSRFDVRWLQALDTRTLQKLHRVLLAPGTPSQVDGDSGRTPAPTPWQNALLDALVFSVGQVSATGFASEIRVRMSHEERARQAFHALPVQVEALRRSALRHGPRSGQARYEAEKLKNQLGVCQVAAETVYGHLEEHGVSVGIVFRLRQLSERVVRIHQLLDCLLSDQPERATAALLADLAQLGLDNRSIRRLVAHSSGLTAAKVAERSAETGERYITRNASEYRHMLGMAAGGGAVLGLTTWVKFGVTALALSAFWAGFAAGLNYALSFVLIQLLHFTVATKQPAVTAPAMAAKLKDTRQPGAVRGFVDEVAHLFRSQIAAILGNVGLVIPVVLLISLLLALTTGGHMIGPEKAEHVIHNLDLLGPSALFAALTGVLLFASSIIAGWVENWFVYYRLDSAIRHNPRFTGWLGRERAARWARFFRLNISGLAANISLGMMLGLVPAFAQFFGLGLDIRHVTLAAGQLAAAGAAIGPDVLVRPDFWWAVAGVAVIGPVNLLVSFYLAFRLALKAQGVGEVNRGLIGMALRRRLRSHPTSFFLPPDADTAPEHEDVSDIEAAWQHGSTRDVLDEENRRWAEAYLERAAGAGDMEPSAWTQVGPLEAQDRADSHPGKPPDAAPQ
ncbi:MAG TPA: site-specific recombinase [Hydrogenophaga sp.]|uniref:site-specific recombinase n=1 Tax=Hydrogenophaga sp. TaxID=1904254 RepID=UPI002B58E577|nr:site-specific recombinase [Hydrogenophaga sp.]HMN92882.1 site-specific recombinase [Hydrogenophaga sp.]HMP10909.1 site-specific recombinase [Hydrogenophaga sp.]